MSGPKVNRNALRVVMGPDMPLGACVAQHLAAISAQPIMTYETLAKAAAVASQTRILLALPGAVESLALRLVDAPSCVVALEAWKAGTVALLADARRMRRNLVLADARSLLSNDADVLAALGITKTPETECEDIPPLPGLMLLVLANALLANDTEASRLVAEIDAMRHGSHVAPLDIEQLDVAHKEYMNLTREIARLQAVQQQADEYGVRLKALEQVQTELAEENTLLRENIGQQISGAEQAESARAQLKGEADSLRKICADRHLVKAQAEALERRIETDKQRAASREAVLGVVILEDEKARQKAGVKTAVGEAYAQELSREVAFLKSELDRVYGSRSWRLTRPLRTVRSSLGKT